jgi:hypothetical protein
MANSTTLRNALDTIVSLHNQVKEETKTTKREFFEFIEANVPGGYLNAPDSPFGERRIEVMENIERFYLVTGFKNDTGIVFVHDIYDGSESVEIPFAYIDDPEEWKKELLERVRRDRELAESVFAQQIPAEHFKIAAVSPLHPVTEYTEINVDLEKISPEGDLFGYHTFRINVSDGSISWISKDLQAFLYSINKPVNKTF